MRGEEADLGDGSEQSNNKIGYALVQNERESEKVQKDLLFYTPPAVHYYIAYVRRPGTENAVASSVRELLLLLLSIALSCSSRIGTV
jgi:hypothetical protein